MKCQLTVIGRGRAKGRLAGWDNAAATLPKHLAYSTNPEEWLANQQCQISFVFVDKSVILHVSSDKRGTTLLLSTMLWTDTYAPMYKYGGISFVVVSFTHAQWQLLISQTSLSPWCHSHDKISQTQHNMNRVAWSLCLISLTSCSSAVTLLCMLFFCNLFFLFLPGTNDKPVYFSLRWHETQTLQQAWHGVML